MSDQFPNDHEPSIEEQRVTIYDRRQASALTCGIEDCQQDFEEKIRILDSRLNEIEKNVTGMKKAFTLDDLNEPGYDTHRKDHIKIKEQDKMLEGYKKTITDTILKWLIKGALFVGALGVVDFLRSHLK